MAKKNKKTSAAPQEVPEEIKEEKVSEAEELVEDTSDVLVEDEATESAEEEVVVESAEEEEVAESAEEEEAAESDEEEEVAESDEEEEVAESSEEEEVAESAEEEEVAESAEEEEVAESAEEEEVVAESAEEEETAESAEEEKAAESAEEEEAAEADEEEEAAESAEEEDEAESAEEEEVAESDEEEEAAESAEEEDEAESDAEEEVAESDDEEEAAESDEEEEAAESDEEEDEVETIQFEDESETDIISDLFKDEDVASTTSDDDSVDLFEEANAAVQSSEDEEPLSEAETVDDDDYLDYDEDDVKVKRPKKIVSGKVAVVTMLCTLVGMIAITAGLFAFLTYYPRDMGLSLVSYSDRFNACDANSFSYGDMLGLGSVSYSDSEMTLSAQDIKDLKSGKTVTKFGGLANITADVRFGKIVSMDFSFSEELEKSESPSGYYMYLAGNVMSGLYSGVKTSDYGFMFAYTVLSGALRTDYNENLYCYALDDLSFYVDYTEAVKDDKLSKVTIHVESSEPHYVNWSNIKLPWSKDNVSSSDVSASDNY